MGAVKLNTDQLDLGVVEETAVPTEVPAPSALRQQVAERLAAHRERRNRLGAAEAEATAAAKPQTPKHRVAAAVAERYAQTPSYRAFLAEQAKLAIQEAAAAAEVAVRNAEAVAQAQQQLLGELELWTAPQEFTPETAQTIEKKVAKAEPAVLTVRHYEELPQEPVVQAAPAAIYAEQPELTVAEAEALDAEIAFRQAPVFEEFWHEAEPTVALPANLLEFPRQLIAARKARPRIAEGPLRDELTPLTSQLRIFEVEPEQIATAPVVEEPAPAMQWTSIRLDAHPAPVAEAVAAVAVEEVRAVTTVPLLASMLPPQTAPLQLRTMSAAVDAILVGAGTLAFIAAYAHAGGRILMGGPAAIAVGVAYVVTHVLYQLLFFTLSDQTPGMRYARIGFCTFADGNPTRAALRRRILAQLVAVAPLGIGLLWIFLDEDGLGWHDRISRIYQRAY